MNVNLSVIIVTYNSSRLIGDCLESIYKYNDIGDALEVIVVDNFSSDRDEMFSIIKSKYRDNVVLLDSGGNFGYGKGNNIGVKHANGDYIIVMNPDVRLVTPIFKDIIKTLGNTKVGMAGVSFMDGSAPYYFKPEYWTVFKYALLKYYIKKQTYITGKMYMSGSMLAFNKSVFIESGMFDENIFMYFEEPDITNRIEKLGYKSEWLSDVKVLHLAHGRSFNKNLNDYWYQSFEYYCQKYGVDSRKLIKIRMASFRINSVIWLILGDRIKSRLYSDTLADMKSYCKK